MRLLPPHFSLRLLSLPKYPLGTFDNFQLSTFHFQLNSQDELGLNWDSFKYRNYDYAIGRFMSVDPLAEKYAYYGVYNFSENRLLDMRELEGLEGVDFRMRLDEAQNNAAKRNISVQEYMDKTSIRNLSVGEVSINLSEKQRLVLHGVGNVTSGLIGAVASGAYIIGTEGVGAALGGAVALDLSLGQMAIGITQITDVVTNDKPTNENLHSKNTLPGLVAGDQNIKNADGIDKVSSLITIPLTGGVNTQPKNIIETMDMVNDVYNISSNVVIPFVSNTTNSINNMNNRSANNQNNNGNNSSVDKEETIQQ